MDDRVTSLSKAADGVVLYMMGHGNLGVFGITKEAFAAKKGIEKVGEGPAKELLEEVVKHKTGSDSDEDTLDVGSRDSEKFKASGWELLTEAKPTIEALDVESAAHVKEWLQDIGRSVAEAAKEKGQKEKVNPGEEKALEEISEFFG